MGWIEVLYTFIYNVCTLRSFSIDEVKKEYFYLGVIGYYKIKVALNFSEIIVKCN
ncbi:hypothetical protein J2Z44_004236 [Clostridium punense]|uniref:XkdX family protein n=1 Tax=Clostridium punense TaxID=1054297 RepID=A0ABS4K9D3_9CLOT|nr:hypothetical protein [Clostridium punense]EQB85824.1 hypothetical protein M918_17465 [Clostridium sp. BL8]MBP2024368.1 hypothetical protein [Clostridium punense]